jgi:hypothetical protein
LALILVLSVAVAAPALAQGTQFGTVRGTVTLPDGSLAPGVTVTATSGAQPGARVVQSTASGEFLLRSLLAGQYRLTFELEGFATQEVEVAVNLGQVTPVEVTLASAQVEGETITVTGTTTSVLANSEVSTTYTAEEVNELPLLVRTPAAIAALAPGLTTNTPNLGQVTISGGFAYDNIFLIDGVDANDNLFGTSSPVFIEDAIADTQVLTSGISAEYGRFSGGVVNVVTKAGGNQFEGSFRADLTNDDWREKTPLEEERGTELNDDISKFYSATLGGYILRDTLWFFGAGRDEESSAQVSLAATGLPFVTMTEEQRFEGKLTWNIGDRHQVQGQYTDRDQSAVNRSFTFSATPDTSRVRDEPSDLQVIRYNGSLTDSLFGELQYSQKQFKFQYSHGDEGLVESSPFFAFFTIDGAGDLAGSPLVHHNAPYFDGTDPEDRDNEQIYGALSWFADTQAMGSHDVKFGYEDYTSINVGGNSQSVTDFVWDTGALTDAAGNYVLDANDKLIPIFVPHVTYIERWIPTRGAEINIETQSLFVNDRWRLNDHWSFNLGVRYEDVASDATGGITTIDTSRVVPRLGASYDVLGDGRYRLDATFAQYAGKYSEAQFSENTTVGNPRGVFLEYVGPVGIGFDFAPAFDLGNYVPFAADDGTANVFVDDDISSPVVTEFTLGGGLEIGRGGYLKAVYTNRSYDDFVEDFLCAAEAGVPCQGPGDTGTVPVNVEGVDAGIQNISIYQNSDIPERNYQALQLIGRRVLTDRWDVNGNWTYQIENEGNFEGENTNQPGISSFFGDFPGFYVPERHFPSGRLNDFQEHKVRLWSTYHLDLGAAGRLASTLLGNYDSGTTFSYFATLGVPASAEQDEILSHYFTSPATSQNVFFGERGAGEFADFWSLDLGLLYNLPVVPAWGLEVFLKGDVFNLTNEDRQILWNTSVAANADGPVDAHGLPTTFTPGAAFGQAQSNLHYQAPREYQLGVGLRF